MNNVSKDLSKGSKFLAYFSKWVCFSTLGLIFVGGMVTSTSSGLAVPDWPLSYGTLFPPMIGGVFYEHGHRMVASSVGFFMLSLVIALSWVEQRKWVKILGWVSLLIIILQGILGGITVLFFLPKPISILHGILAQTFFILTIVLAYSLSQERTMRENRISYVSSAFLKMNLGCCLLIYVQLILGALMRHTGSGLAIPDFPTMGEQFIPSFNETMLQKINTWRFMQNLEPVNIMQIIIHFLHRLWSLIIALAVIGLNVLGFKYEREQKNVLATLVLLDCLVVLQIILGIITLLSGKDAVTTSLHVATGAAALGASILLLLRASPIPIRAFKTILTTR